jgi:hypothetical protein
MAYHGKTEKPIRETLMEMNAWYQSQWVKFSRRDVTAFNKRFNQLDDLAHLREPAYLMKIGDCSL